MPGRDVSIPPVAEERRRPRRRAHFLAAIALLAAGIAIGNRIASPDQGGSAALTTVTTAPPANGRVDTPDSSPPSSSPPVASARTREGAVAAAASSVTAFDGNVLLEPDLLRAVVTRIASASSRAALLSAFEQASAQTRAKLGADTFPAPVIVLRSVPVGYRVEQFSSDEATIAVWYVGIVGSGASVQPQQSWRTQVVTLVWEDGTWKVSSFASSPGPTPPLSSAEVAEPAGELFAAIPRFEEFGRAEP